MQTPERIGSSGPHETPYQPMPTTPERMADNSTAKVKSCWSRFCECLAYYCCGSPTVENTRAAQPTVELKSLRKPRRTPGSGNSSGTYDPAFAALGGQLMVSGETILNGQRVTSL